MEFTGQANAKELAEVFQMVASSSRAGRLTVASGERRLSFYFSPEGVTLLSDGGLRSTDLAAELIGEGAITPQRASGALAEQEMTGGYLGEILARQGAVEEEAVPDLVYRQIQAEILGLCTWEQGSFDFAEGELSPEVREEYRFATEFTFDPHHLLMDAARRLDEWSRLKASIPSENAIFTRVEKQTVSESTTITGPVATAVSVLVDGTRTVDEIVGSTHFSRFEVFEILARFLEDGQIRLASVEELLDSAEALVCRREFDRAARLYTHLAALRPEDAVMPLKAGQLFQERGKTPEALAAYRAAVDRLASGGMPAQALGVLDVMRTLDPDAPFALKTSVTLRLAVGETAEAAADAAHLTDLLAKDEQTDGAIESARLVADLRPKDTSASRTLAGLLGRTGRAPEAADELERLADLYRQSGQTGRYRRVLREIEAVDPGRLAVRRALTELARPTVTRRRRWSRAAVIGIAAGLVLVAITFAIIYETVGRQAYRSVKCNADDLARHRRYGEAAALFEDVARRFRFSSVAESARRSQREFEARALRHSVETIDAGTGTADAVVGRIASLGDDLALRMVEGGDEAASFSNEFLVAAAILAQAKRAEAQAKYAEARSLYAKLVRDHPDMATFWNVELPLMVESVPSGSEVYVNGNHVGRTPTLVRHPPFAAYRIVIQQAGFKPYESILEAGEEVVLGAELPRRPQWEFRSGGAIESRVACDGRRVFFGSRDGHVYAVTAQDGKLVWKFDTGTLGDVTCSPAVAGGRLFAGSHDHYLYALESTSGRQLWRFRTGKLIRSTPCVVERHGLVCVGSYDRFVYGLDAAEGTLRWQFRTDGPVVGSPCASGDLVFIGSQDRRLYALQAVDGKPRWRFNAGGGIQSAPVIADGVVYFGAEDGYVYAVEAGSGTIRWSFKTGGPIEGSPRVHRSMVYVGSSDGIVYALGVERGALRWKYRTGGSIRGTPAVNGRALYVGSDDRCLHVLDLTTGTLRWRARTGGALSATPVIADNVLFIGSKDASLYAFRLADEPIAGTLTPATASERVE